LRENDCYYELKEPEPAYNVLFIPEKRLLRVENRFYLNE
jgi:hypothetical protein